MKARKLQGFTLIELMIAVVILGILTAIALPSYTNQVAKSRRADCMGILMGFSQAMEKHYTTGYSYLGAGVSGADTGAPAPGKHPNKCPIEGATYYNLTIQAAAAQSYTLRATPASGKSQVGDGYLEVNSLGQRRWDKNNDGDTGDTGETNWEK
jgi:type IV pilus assembly protein PilE